MIKRIWLISLFHTTFLSTAMALPWLPNKMPLPTSMKTTQVKKNSVQESQVNFSGDWVGQCDNAQAVDLRIQHDQSKISISYGFMEEKYYRGEVRNTSSAQGPRSESSQTSVRWNIDNNALIFIHANLFANEYGNLNSFFSKVSMFIENDQLIVNGQYYYTNANIGPIQVDTITCYYVRKG